MNLIIRPQQQVPDVYAYNTTGPNKSRSLCQHLDCQVFAYKDKIIYAIDANGVHHTTDTRFYDYMLMRKETPKKVIVHTTLRELKEVLLKE